MTRLYQFIFCLLLALLPGAVSAAEPPVHTFAVGEGAFLLDGKPFVIKAAEMHYLRIPRPYWEHRLQLCKALGMNAVCVYVFWNYHEQREGEISFEGQGDVAEFCRLAWKHGLYVIVRPGPYACAEWEMGGLPWWLLKKKDIRLREQDPYFMERAEAFETAVGAELSPLTVEKGGPIIMVQVENEYGSYGEDKPYMSAMRDIIRRAWGSDVVLFQCDWSSNFWKNGLDDLLWTMNFGTGADIDRQFKRLGELRPSSPRMCSEFWSGWFDKWGARHETRPADKMVAGISDMLERDISFSLYMTHGGTSFGHWAGANSPGFNPDVTSYDYDAPINEQGQPTEKYFLLRQLLGRYAPSPLPAVGKTPLPIIAVKPFELTDFRPIRAGYRHHTQSADPLTLEDLDTGWGSVAYATSLPALPDGGMLHIDEAHDFAQVFVGGRRIGTLSRQNGEKTLRLPAVRRGEPLVILVEAMGRINFGRSIKDYKGIVGDVTVSTTANGHDVSYTLRQWTIDAIPDDYATAAAAFSGEADGSTSPTDIGDGIGYYRAFFNINKVGDTFLNMEGWGKGQVYVNGHELGRFWSVGPQQTLYMPGCWLKKGRNEIIVLDVVGPTKPVVFGQTTHELNKLRLPDPPRHDLSELRPAESQMTLVAEGDFEAGAGWQRVSFPVQTGRYVALECVDTYEEGARVCIAELYLDTPQGRRLSREPWTVRYASSETFGGNHTADKVIDLQESTFWQTSRESRAPHLLVLDLGSSQTFSALEYLPRMDAGTPGATRHYRIYTVRLGNNL